MELIWHSNLLKEANQQILEHLPLLKKMKISVKAVISMLLEQFIMLEITELATWQHMLINLS